MVYSIVKEPVHGMLSGTGSNLIYTPDVNYIGFDNFTFTVSDGHLTSEPGVVSINILPGD